jgi:hypothetical protein
VPIEELMDRIHGALRSTRGAAVALSRVSTEDAAVRFASVGNVAGAVLDGKDGARQMISVPGTVGHEVHKVRQFSYEFQPGSLAVFCSDGILTRWTLDPYPGLPARDASLIAGVIYRDFKRGRDDATVVVLRHKCDGSGGE